MSAVTCREWIIEFGAAHHISSSLNLLEQGRPVYNSSKNKVYLLTEDKENVTRVGATTILKEVLVINVLYVPEFKFNLLVVSKLSKELSCSVNFSLIFVYFTTFTVAE